MPAAPAKSATKSKPAAAPLLAEITTLTHRSSRTVRVAVRRFNAAESAYLDCIRGGLDYRNPARLEAREASYQTAIELADAIRNTELQGVVVGGIIYVVPYGDDTKGVSPVIVLRPSDLASAH